MSIIPYIKTLSDDLIKKFDSTNPVELVHQLKRVEFAVQPLSESVNGFFNYISPNKQMIVINSNLSEENFKFTLFHELGHYFLGHKDTLLLNSSYTMNLKKEYQADLFATYMYLNYIQNYDFDSFANVYFPNRVKELMHYFL
ncbi:ImmA/IrrE family metallo-endopeptidase [Clostridium baratii]|uniref:ImmA/IrrE family metallo-endopeptidase n=1 Tax=Clostridium baratii TaxID=1561 RepID=UPI0030D35E12